MAARKLCRYLFVISIMATTLLVYLNLNIPKRQKYYGNVYLEKDIIGNREWMTRKELVYSARKKKIREVCKKYARDEIWRAKAHGSQFVYDLQNGLAVCMHPKVICLQLLIVYKGTF